MIVRPLNRLFGWSSVIATGRAPLPHRSVGKLETANAIQSVAFIAAAVIACAPSRASSAQRTGTEDEARLIRVLESGALSEAKLAACAGLHRMATERAVPALAALLAEPRLSHAARYVLESMPYPAAGRALIDALETTSGDERLGIIGSLGVRRETGAVPGLARLLLTATRAEAGDDGFGVAAAAALGEIAAPPALAALEEGWEAARGSLHRAVADALLRQAERRLDAGDRPAAQRVFQQVRDRAEDDHVRMAAWQGTVRAAGEDGLPLLVAALRSPHGSWRQAALRLVPEVSAAGAGREFAGLLPELSAPTQAALLNGWIQRSDPPGLESVAPLLRSPAPELRNAAIRALARVGDASVVQPLLEAAAAPGLSRKAAREALAQLPKGDVAGRLLSALQQSPESLQLEAIRALAERSERQAVERLLELARGGSGHVRAAALRALIVLLDEARLEALVRLVIEAADEARRREAARALALVCERLQPGPATPGGRALLAAMTDGAVAVRAALLPVGSALASGEVRAALRAAIADPDPQIRAAAVRAAARTVDAELLPDLLQLAGGAAEEELRELATKACVRLAPRPETSAAAEARLALFRTLVSRHPSLVQKRALLAGLSSGRTRAELELAESFLVDDAVRFEATTAVLTIAPRVAEAASALAALRRLPPGEADSETAREIAAAVKSVEARAGYLTSWQATEPWRVAGRTATDLPEVTFAPEERWSEYRTAAARARLAKWTLLAVGTDARFPMHLRGGGADGFGVVYVYTWVRSEREQDARLEIKHDEDLKVWLSGRLVLAGAGGGPLAQAEPDRVGVRLESGWNLLALKIAQPSRSWSFAARLLNLDGTALDGVTSDAAAEPGR